jgi:hypothetical protein
MILAAVRSPTACISSSGWAPTCALIQASSCRASRSDEQPSEPSPGQVNLDAAAAPQQHPARRRWRAASRFGLVAPYPGTSITRSACRLLRTRTASAIASSRAWTRSRISPVRSASRTGASAGSRTVTPGLARASVGSLLPGRRVRPRSRLKSCGGTSRTMALRASGGSGREGRVARWIVRKGAFSESRAEFVDGTGRKARLVSIDPDRGHRPPPLRRYDERGPARAYVRSVRTRSYEATTGPPITRAGALVTKASDAAIALRATRQSLAGVWAIGGPDSPTPSSGPRDVAERGASRCEASLAPCVSHEEQPPRCARSLNDVAVNLGASWFCIA